MKYENQTRIKILNGGGNESSKHRFVSRFSSLPLFFYNKAPFGKRLLGGAFSFKVSLSALFSKKFRANGMSSKEYSKENNEVDKRAYYHTGIQTGHPCRSLRATHSGLSLNFFMRTISKHCWYINTNKPKGRGL